MSRKKAIEKAVDKAFEEAGDLKSDGTWIRQSNKYNPATMDSEICKDEYPVEVVPYKETQNKSDQEQVKQDKLKVLIKKNSLPILPHPDDKFYYGETGKTHQVLFIELHGKALWEVELKK